MFDCQILGAVTDALNGNVVLVAVVLLIFTSHKLRFVYRGPGKGWFFEASKRDKPPQPPKKLPTVSTDNPKPKELSE
jgi:hypothetical protein